jgi:GABA permease
MRDVLVVANQTLMNQDLIDAVTKRCAEGECSFTLLIPAVRAKSNTMKGMLAVSVNIPETGSSGPDEFDVARRRLDAAIEMFRKAGVRVDGEVGDFNPMKAIDASLKNGHFDEVIISTLSRNVSRWMRQDLPHRVERKFNLPVTVVTAPG